MTEVKKRTRSKAVKMKDGGIPQGVPAGFFIYNAEDSGKIVFADENIVKLYECDSLDDFMNLTGGCFSGMVYSEDYGATQGAISKQTVFGAMRHDYVRYRIQTKSGKLRYVEDFGHLVHAEGGVSYYYVYIVDIDQNEYYNNNKNSYAESQVLEMNQEMDSLTGMWNQAHFYQVVQEKMTDMEIRRQGITVIYFDLNHFKLFNEKYGFQKGDELLYDIARLLWHSFLERMVARFSEDHFVVCTFSRDVESTVLKIHDDVAKLVPGAKLEIKAGIYKVEQDCNDIGLACDHARLACKNIKKRYDIPYAFYNEDIHSKLQMQQFVLDNIDDAVENENIKVFYQPVIRTRTGEICGYEALARWKDPEKGLIPPGGFIEILEEHRQIHKLDMFMVKKVCEDYADLRDRGEMLVPVSINLSRLDFNLCNVIDEIEKYRNEVEMPVNMLDIEVTESALMEDDALIKREIDHFRELGYQVWIDDFGSGYSSLTTILDYKFDTLKLDLAFLRQYDRNPKAGTVLGFIIQAAHSLGHVTLTEGVETEEHFEFLKTIGCDKAQGYHFGKPQPMEESRKHTTFQGMTWEKCR
ncbi:bifunctional diguanylate cyclase/phosphodiesterase [Butyrivibrio sp. INlla16]|uniref:putative bifunctional diguanylate cyclase/phosphodiesterase n=1 Tax=Butyrivibrio sp. INlla16 TaxID=1520807 RepID=UPI000880F894|nr:bifunctional diguanylate cyclase/phosphodiesterase [Butyrivibrio sp. INlla16]SDB59186.1 diguanylate cyclase (GGDEF) domain-containing protein [Butyrivibrio sp. INlla16]